MYTDLQNTIFIYRYFVVKRSIHMINSCMVYSYIFYYIYLWRYENYPVEIINLL